jgi:uncharacterized protein (DUF488 family)
MSLVCTVGHGARSFEQLVTVLRDGDVGLVIDVRRYPGSRRHPQFGRGALAAELPGAGIAYDWRGDELGGRRTPVEPSNHPEWRDAGFRAFADYTDTAAFAEALDRLVADGSGPVRPAVMCAETLWWRCHRRLIAEALTARGVDVVHLIEVGQHQPHPAGLV